MLIQILQKLKDKSQLAAKVKKGEINKTFNQAE